MRATAPDSSSPWRILRHVLALVLFVLMLAAAGWLALTLTRTTVVPPGRADSVPTASTPVVDAARAARPAAPLPGPAPSTPVILADSAPPVLDSAPPPAAAPMEAFKDFSVLSPRRLTTAAPHRPAHPRPQQRSRPASPPRIRTAAPPRAPTDLSPRVAAVGPPIRLFH